MTPTISPSVDFHSACQVHSSLFHFFTGDDIVNLCTVIGLGAAIFLRNL